MNVRVKFQFEAHLQVGVEKFMETWKEFLLCGPYNGEVSFPQSEESEGQVSDQSSLSVKGTVEGSPLAIASFDVENFLSRWKGSSSITEVKQQEQEATGESPKGNE